MREQQRQGNVEREGDIENKNKQDRGMKGKKETKQSDRRIEREKTNNSPRTEISKSTGTNRKRNSVLLDLFKSRTCNQRVREDKGE